MPGIRNNCVFVNPSLRKIRVKLGFPHGFMVSWFTVYSVLEPKLQRETERGFSYCHEDYSPAIATCSAYVVQAASFQSKTSLLALGWFR